MTRADKAREYFLRGMTCSQATLAAFCGEDETLMAIARPFGGGMGRLRLTCGAVTGCVMALGVLCADKEKGELYLLVQEFCARFRAACGSIQCGELLAGVRADASPIPSARTEEYYVKRPCPELVYTAAHLLEELLSENAIG